MGAVSKRVEKLQAEHRAIDEEIQDLQKRPSPDSLAVKDRKRKKLRIKEQLQALRAQVG